MVWDLGLVACFTLWHRYLHVFCSTRVFFGVPFQATPFRHGDDIVQHTQENLG